jgi:hypothetical protein
MVCTACHVRLLLLPLTCIWQVTDDMKTKNRADRGPGVVSVKERGPTGAPAGPGGQGGGKPVGPPRMGFDADRKKWMVENQVSGPGHIQPAYGQEGV